MNQKTKPIDIQEYWQIAKRRKWFLILPFLTIVVAIAVGSFFMERVYESSTTVLIGRRRLLSQSVERMVPGARGRERIETLRRQILSRAYLSQVINILGLKNNEELRSRAEKFQSQYKDMSVDEIMEMWLINSLRRSLEVRQKGSDFIEIKAQSTDPEFAFLLAKTLTQVFIDESLKSELGGIRGALEFSSEQLAIYKKKLEESEEKLRRFKQGMIADQVESQSIASENIGQIRSMITSVEFELRDARDQLNFLNSKLKDSVKGISLPNSTYLANLKAKLLEAVVQLPQLMLKYSWRDAKVVKLNEDIARLREEIKQEIKRIAISYLNIDDETLLDQVIQRETLLMDVDFLNRKKRALVNLIDTYKANLAKAPTREMTLSRLQQEVDANREIYNMFLRQVRGSQIEEALQRTEAEFKYKIVEPAIRPLKPVKPNIKKLMVVAFMLGSMLGFGIVFLLEYTDHSFKNVEEVERYLSLPVLATIPRMDFLTPERAGERLLVLKIMVPVVLLAALLVFALKSGFLNL